MNLGTKIAATRVVMMDPGLDGWTGSARLEMS